MYYEFLVALNEQGNIRESVVVEADDELTGAMLAGLKVRDNGALPYAIIDYRTEEEYYAG